MAFPVGSHGNSGKKFEGEASWDVVGCRGMWRVFFCRDTAGELYSAHDGSGWCCYINANIKGVY